MQNFDNITSDPNKVALLPVLLSFHFRVCGKSVQINVFELVIISHQNLAAQDQNLRPTNVKQQSTRSALHDFFGKDRGHSTVDPTPLKRYVHDSSTIPLKFASTFAISKTFSHKNYLYHRYTMSSNNHNNDSVMMTLTDGGEDMDDDSAYTEDDEMSIDSAIADDDENYLNGLKDDFVRLTRPQIPSPHMISVDELRNQLSLHENNRTMAQLLTMPIESPERDEDYVAATEFKYIDNIKEVPNGNVLGKHVIVSKAYGNPLHYACHDPDGKRGREKIRLILDAARKAHVDLRKMMLQEELTYSLPGDEEEVDEFAVAPHEVDYDKKLIREWNEQSDTTPMWILLSNQNAVFDSVQLLCQAWPDVVTTMGGHGQTILQHLLRNCPRLAQGRKVIERHTNLIKLMLDTAQHAIGGPRALVEGYQTTNDAISAVHYLCFLVEEPSRFLPIILKHCPDVLMHRVEFCGEASDFPTYPFHDGVTTNDVHPNGMKSTLVLHSNESAIRNMCALLEHSSIRGLANALIKVDWRRQKAGYVVANETIEYDKEGAAGVDLKQNARAAMRAMVSRKRSNGRGMFHYIAIQDFALSQKEIQTLVGKERKSVDENSTLDPTIDVQQKVKERVRNMEQRNANVIGQAIQWLSEFSEEKAFKKMDNKGRNALHYALACGKRWETGIRGFVENVDAEWTAERDSNGFFPFMVAAMPRKDETSPADIDTIFHLLRRSPQVILEIQRQHSPEDV